MLLGFLAAACALAIPLLPVVQDTARIDWPVANNPQPVNAPLTGYWAQSLDAHFPCEAITSLDNAHTKPALLLSTVPHKTVDQGAGIQMRVANGTVTVVNRGREVVTQPLPKRGCDVSLDSTALRTSITIAGQPVWTNNTDVRPRVVGIYTDLSTSNHITKDLHVAITPDTRYQTEPTFIKTAATIIGVLALIGCLIATSLLDADVARRAPRWAPIGWWKLTLRDCMVIGALGLWVFIGPVTSDDGYITSMSRVAGPAGYLTNYHRWFGVAEAPFGWNDHIIELMAQVSTAPPWIRLPSFVLAVLSWMLISREIIPRLGRQVRLSTAAGWAAAAVFLVWWMPFNNGVRPEPFAAAGSLLALTAVERTLVTRRMLPLCLGLLAAAFALAATPTGLIAVAPFIVAARPLFALLRDRAREGWAHVLLPIAASGFAVMFVVFADQTLATVMEATRIRNHVGPSMSWFQEYTRYALLFGSGGDDGDDSLVRRFPVLLIFLCLATCLAVILRRGRIPGAALGPSRRLIGTCAMFFVLLALTPTKWTHHFGAFAAVGSAMAALTALATSTSVLRSARNRNAFLAGLLLVAALATTGPNSYWFVSKLGVPWNDKPPGIAGIGLSSVLVIGAVVAAIAAFIQNVKAHRPHKKPDKPERPSRALLLSSASLTIVCGLVALSEFATVAVAAYNQRGSYSLAAANIEHLFGSSCNLSDHVAVEKDPSATVLKPYPDQRQQTAKPADGVDDTATSQDDKNNTAGKTTKHKKAKHKLPEPPQRYGISSSGFHTRPVDNDDPLSSPPQGFAGNKVPLWSSYGTGEPNRSPDSGTGRLQTRWFQLSPSDMNKQLVVSVSGGQGPGMSVAAEFATRTKHGFRAVHREPMPVPPAVPQRWTDSRIAMPKLPQSVTAVRLVVEDNDLTENGWVAVSAPRVPTMTTLTDRVGDKPVYMDWPVSFVYPCFRSPSVHDGISEIPEYRITSGPLANEAGWASSPGGGPIGWMEQIADMPESPSVMLGDAKQPWGQLLQVDLFESGQKPHVTRGSETEWGWWSPGPGPLQPDGRMPTR